MKVLVCIVVLFVVCTLGQKEIDLPKPPCLTLKCSTNYDPVCCYYEDKTFKEYDNECIATSFICSSGRSCDRAVTGPCPKEDE
ncbi:hypothetical protein DMENIID0001_019510 [Sergentomyia squamirostris]